MICENCGAEIDAHEKACPYCGHINPAGAEEAYMDRLEDLQEDLEDLRDHGRRSDREEMKRQGRRLFRIGLILALVIGLATAGLISLDRLWMRSARDEKALMEFQKKYFGELDALYAAGDDDATLEYMISLLDSGEKGVEAVYDWKHYEYIEALWTYRDGVKAAEDILDKEWTDDMAADAMLDAFRLRDQAEHAGELPPEDRKKVRDLGEKGMSFLEEVIGMSREEAKELYERLKNEKGEVGRRSVSVSEWMNDLNEKMGRGGKTMSQMSELSSASLDSQEITIPDEEAPEEEEVTVHVPKVTPEMEKEYLNKKNS